MAYRFSSLKSAGDRIAEWFTKELATMRTGRATPALIENIIIDAYGAKSPIKQNAAISVEDARTMRVQPWDASLLKGIEKALIDSSLGGQIIVDSESVRVSLPELTEERRRSLIKLAGKKLEEARVSLRGERDDILKDIRNSGMSEDEEKRAKEEVERTIRDIEKRFESIEASKIEEISD